MQLQPQRINNSMQQSSMIPSVTRSTMMMMSRNNNYPLPADVLMIMNHHHQQQQLQQCLPSPQMIPCRPHSQPYEVFVGNLSYFCEEIHLYQLFNQYAHVANVRIIRNEDRSRSLLFGFVALKNAIEVNEMANLFNNHMFMGRAMKVEPTDRKSPQKVVKYKGFQVHVAITSSFPVNEVPIKPTETFLRRFFLQYGMILDLQVNVYFANQIPGKQEGYAFITFVEETSAQACIATFTHYVHGLTMVCTRTQRDCNLDNLQKGFTSLVVPPHSVSAMMTTNALRHEFPSDESKRDLLALSKAAMGAGTMHPPCIREGGNYGCDTAVGHILRSQPPFALPQESQDVVPKQINRRQSPSPSTAAAAALFQGRRNPLPHDSCFCTGPVSRCQHQQQLSLHLLPFTMDATSETIGNFDTVHSINASDDQQCFPLSAASASSVATIAASSNPMNESVHKTGALSNVDATFLQSTTFNNNWSHFY